MNLGIPFNRKDILCIPRVSGDEPLAAAIKHLKSMYSPRERG